MTQEPIEIPKPLLDAESLVKDRFHDYLLVTTDGEHVYCVHSSKTSAIGLGRYVQLLAEHDLEHNLLTQDDS